jgi:hypothetical protein
MLFTDSLVVCSLSLARVIQGFDYCLSRSIRGDFFEEIRLENIRFSGSLFLLDAASITGVGPLTGSRERIIAFIKCVFRVLFPLNCLSASLCRLRASP